jgi:hypothetical protein
LRVVGDDDHHGSGIFCPEVTTATNGEWKDEETVLQCKKSKV